MKVGIDLGGSHIAIGVIDENKCIIEKIKSHWRLCNYINFTISFSSYIFHNNITTNIINPAIINPIIVLNPGFLILIFKINNIPTTTIIIMYTRLK